ncbi:alanine racemase [Sphingorhabdus buctiana]|uniref:Alanine racemase n=1 Tax=Sphingorhabdus buctiana TaxID=1508805 RepID=A0ABW4MC04_9SPHN
MSFPAPSRLRLDGAALVANWKYMAELSGSAAAGAAVKANAYGLGAREVAPRLWAAGCRDFFVAHWGEAAEIADLVPAQNIYVLNGICEEDVVQARELGAIPVLNTPAQIALWRASGGGRCHVMLDSGMNRLGLGPEQYDPMLFDGMDIDIAMSHLASADEITSQNAAQLVNFIAMSQHIGFRRRSLANSCGITLGADYHFDLTRPGISLYGGLALDGLQQVAYPEARILQVRDLPAGSPVGYNYTYVAKSDIRVATVAIGYADGYVRALSNVGTALVGGVELPVIGRVSMDLVTLDISNAPSLSENDWVTMRFNLDAQAKLSGVSPYELLTGMGSRSDRHWN